MFMALVSLPLVTDTRISGVRFRYYVVAIPMVNGRTYEECAIMIHGPLNFLATASLRYSPVPLFISLR